MKQMEGQLFVLLSEIVHAYNVGEAGKLKAKCI